MQDLNITLAQTDLHWENPRRNADMFLHELDFSEQIDLIVLPEMFTTGFSMHTEIAREAGEMALSTCRELSKKTNAAVCGSSMFVEDGKYYNRLIFQKPNEAPLFYDKRHLFSLAGEEKYYSSGNSKLIVEWKGWKILPLVCYDLRFPVWSRRTVENNYDLLLYTANWPDRRSYAWRTLAKARAIENQSYVAAVNRVGSDGKDMAYAGDSMLIDYAGKAIQKARPFKKENITTVLRADKLKSFRERLAFFNDGDSFDIK
jgi:omega-amidase